MRPRFASCVALLLVACAVEERSDYLVGRTCLPDIQGSCDPGQACLPHAYEGGEPADFRCRDEASFEKVQGSDPPLAYCDEEEGFACPGRTVCRADRVRDRDGGIRRTVCQLEANPFKLPEP